MQYRKLGNSGLDVSAVGLGTNNFGRRVDAEGTRRVLDRALDEGITFIDTANIYSGGQSEEYIGRGIKGKRHEYILATKCGMKVDDGPNGIGASRNHIFREVEKSLRRLGTDYIDLYQIHTADPSTPIEETLRALDQLVAQGKVRYTGCSNYAAWQLTEALWTSRAHHLSSYITVQPHYSMLRRDVEAELVACCEQYGIGILPYFPLANGFLTGKYRRGEAAPEGTRLAENDRGMFTDANFDLLEALESWASEHGRTILDLAFAWLLANPSVSSVIAGATQPEQVAANAAAVDWELTPAERQEVTAILDGDAKQ